MARWRRDQSDMINAPLADLLLPPRFYRALKRASINTIGQLLAVLPQGPSAIRGIGPKGWTEIETALTRYLNHYPLSPIEHSSPNSGLKEIPQSKPGNSQASIVTSLTYQDAFSSYQDVSIEVLGLSTRAYNCLRQARLHTVAHVASCNDADLLQIRCLDVTTLNEIREKLKAWMDAHPPDKVQTEQISKEWSLEAREHTSITTAFSQEGTRSNESDIAEKTLEQWVEEWLTPLKERQRTVLWLRYGLEDKPLTLEKVGQLLGVTRERVRQIQQRALSNIKKPTAYVRVYPLISLLQTLLLEAGGIMSEEEIGKAFGDRLEVGRVNPVGVARLLCATTDGIHEAPRLRAWGLTNKPLDLVPEIVFYLKRVLEQEKVPLSWPDLLSRFRAEWTTDLNCDLPEDSFILACVRVSEEIIQQGDGTWGLSKWEAHRLDKIIMALRQIGRPAHYTEITSYVNELLPPKQRTTPRNIHAQLLRYTELFARVGHGIYALVEWNIPQDQSLADAIYRVLREAGQPLHVDLIAERVLKTWQVKRSSIYAAIQNDDRFVKVGHGVYYLRDLLAQGRFESSQIDFSEFFGDHLARWQSALESQAKSGDVDTHAEVEKLRTLGLNFFT